MIADKKRKIQSVLRITIRNITSRQIEQSPQITITG